MNDDKRILTDDEIDAIGEVLNISMGAAATAVSTMLERQVVITTPNINQNQFKNVDFSSLEPAVVVKIKYIEGLSGINVIVFKRNDMGIILDLLMGNDAASTDEYEFDEMSMSAACEVMNQMMGSSATALSEMLNKTINISTPQATLVERSDDAQQIFDDIDEEENVVEVSFKMTIKDTLDTTFTCIMPLGLSKEIVRAVNGEIEDAPVAEIKQQPQIQQKTMAQPQAPQAPQQMMQQAPQPPISPPMQQGIPADPQYSPYAAQTPMAPNAFPYQQPYGQPFDPAFQYMQYQQPLPQQPYPQQPLPQQPYGQPYPRQTPYGQPNQYQDQQQNTRYVMPSLNVKQAEFPDFSGKNAIASAGFGSNMNMLMGVQLEVSVVIGRAKQKIKDVLELGQGSVIELDKQTGSPAEIVVNGQLIAYGDVVVVGDNFGIRITDIVGTKELIDSLEKNNK